MATTHICRSCGVQFKCGWDWANEVYCKKCWHNGAAKEHYQREANGDPSAVQGAASDRAQGAAPEEPAAGPPSKYEYQMIQIPPSLSVSAESRAGNEAASYLQTVVNGQARRGWDFYRIDTFGIIENPGCLLGLLGVRAQHRNHFVVTFRRLRGEQAEGID